MGRRGIEGVSAFTLVVRVALLTPLPLSHLTTSYQHSESELWLEHERAKNAQLLTRLEEAEKKLRAKTGAVISSPSPLKSPLKTSSPRHSPRNSPGQPLGDLLSHGGKLVRSNTF